MASFCPTTLEASVFSKFSKYLASDLITLVTGTPVIRATTPATSSLDRTSLFVSLCFAFSMHLFAVLFIVSYLFVKLVGFSFTNTEADFFLLLLLIPLMSSSIVIAIVLFVISFRFFLVHGLKKGWHSVLALIYMLLPGIVLIV